MKTTVALSVLFALTCAAVTGCSSGGDPNLTRYVDTHVHIRAGSPQGFQQAAASALAAMDSLGIVESLVLPPPRPANAFVANDYQPFAALVQAYPGRFGFLAGGASLNPLIQQAVASGQVTEANKQQFKSIADEIAAAGACGYGEMTAEHFSLGPDHPYESAPPDHPLFLLLSDIAAQKDIPIDLHMEAAPGASILFPSDQFTSGGIGNPSSVTGNLDALGRLLAHNRKTRIIWDHIGWDHTGYRTPEATSALLKANPNLYMSIKDHPDSPEQNQIMQSGAIKPAWLEVFKAYPDRFVMGSDMFYVPPGSPGVGPGTPDGPRNILNQLPADLVPKFAYENADRIFKLHVTASDARWATSQSGSTTTPQSPQTGTVPTNTRVPGGQAGQMRPPLRRPPRIRGHLPH